MNTLKLAGSTVAGIVIGGIAFSSIPALAEMAVIDVSSIAQQIQSVAKETGILDVLNAMSTVQNTINQGIADFNKAIGLNTYGDTNTLLRQGFTQNANYAKAQIGAQQQIVDASNTVMSQFQLGIRQAQIRDEQAPSPTQCTALDGGVGTQAAAVQAYDLAATLAGTHDMRGEATQGMPSYLGTRQGVQSNAANHIALYCDTTDQAAGLCSNGVSAKPDADQRSGSLFGAGTYPDQASVVAAKDFAINLIEPVAPAALRGDQLNSLAGQDAAVQRRSFNARMSLAQSFVDEAIGMQSPSIPTTALTATVSYQSRPPCARKLVVVPGPSDRSRAPHQRRHLERNPRKHASRRGRARDRVRNGSEQLPVVPEFQAGDEAHDDWRHAARRNRRT